MMSPDVSPDYKHLAPNHTISFENVLMMIHSLNRGFAVRNPCVQNNAIIILMYIATTLPPQLLPVCLTNISNAGSFENEALENEDRSTKHPNLENEAPSIENEDP